jgi:hypothetical protein
MVWITRGRWIPLGNAPYLGLLDNVFGDISMIIRVDVFRQLGGFSEVQGAAYTDWSAPLQCIDVLV